MPIQQITPLELQLKKQVQPDLKILDVRETSEFEVAHIDDSVLIPLSLIPLKVDELSPDDEWVVLCHHGVRSMMACRFLAQAGFEKLYNLLGGIDAWSLECDPAVPRY
jgi:rhodanese-related sulfurtransferase